MAVSTFTESLGTIQLFGKVWPVEAPKAVLVLLHGLGEHIERYEHVAAFMNAQGFGFLGIDLPGHGQSGGKRGHGPDLSTYLDVVAVAREKAKAYFGDSPLFLYGHSMGGNIVLNYLLDRQGAGFQGVIATSAWIKLKTEPPAFKIGLGRLMNRLYPAFSQPNGLDPNDISRDKAVVQKYQSDPLVHNQITASTGISIYDKAQFIQNFEGPTPIPLLLIHGTADPITDPAGSEQLAAQLQGDVELQLFPGLYHETHNEPEQAQVLNRIADWIHQHITASA
ncbi:MAG: lysophospholipase [Phaeodactylibacter sp.]|nr:lysophospholipase [Phaeodactylibacter sp.]